MSKIITPIPPLQIGDDFHIPPMARWWRFRTVPNEDGYHYTVTTDAYVRGEDDDGTWVSFEFYDDHSVVIDTGFDRPTLARVVTSENHIWVYVDVLSIEQPTPSSRWRGLTPPGVHEHPNDSDRYHKETAREFLERTRLR